MNKLLGKFVKVIINKENSYRLNKNELQECGGNSPIEEQSKLNVYKNFEFDCDYNENEVSVESQKEMEDQINLNLETSKSECECDVSVLPSGDKKRTHSETIELECVDSDFKNTSDVCSEVEEKIKSLKPETKGVQKAKTNTYVINITNSKNFYVGSLKTINVGDLDKDNLSEFGMSMDWSSSMGGNTKYNLDSLLDSEEKLTEDNITLISMYLDHRWKDFGKSLGFEELFLDELEKRNDGKTCLIVYDFLWKYLSVFPNTSLGFVAYVLNKIQLTNVLEKLAENKRF